jgi:hypothetical protein
MPTLPHQSKRRAAHQRPLSTSSSSAAESPVTGLLRLQQILGNRAFQRQVAVDAPSEPAAPLLNPQQVQRALNFYAAQPGRYTRAIIMEIQFAVDSVPTGVMTAADVQAVARRQQAMNDAGETPALAVDGMAGPRTLPSIFRIGLAQDNELDTFSAEARELLANPQGRTDEQVAQALCDQLNTRLSNLNIPQVRVDTTQQVGGRGVFDFRAWELRLDQRQFTDPALRDMTKTASTVYHEGRHAEQYFRIAQMLAGRGRSARAIHAETQIEQTTVDAAVQNPLQRGTMEAVIAEGWYDSLFGAAGVARKERNSAELRAAFAAREAARRAHESNPTPQTQARLTAAEARYDRAVAEHDDMPHEFDAERLEARVEDAL